MKTPILAMLLALAAAPAWADGPSAQPTARPYATAQPGARPYPQATPQTYARPVGISASAQVRVAATPLTRSAYPSYPREARAAARPAAPSGPARHIGDFHPYWSTGLRVGAGLPLGSMANFNGVGFGGQMDAFYQAAPSTALELMALYVGMPPTSLPSDTSTTFYQGTPQPTSVMGLGVKGLWQFYDADKTRFFLAGGIGYVSLNRTQETVQNNFPGAGDTTWTAGAGPSINGLLMTAGVGVTYELIGNLKLIGEVDFNGVDLAGGTGDMPQYAQPTVGLLYDFK